LGLQLSQIGMCTLVDLTMKLIKLTLQGPLYPGNNFFNELTFQQNYPLRRGVLDTTLCDKVCQWPRAGQWFSLGTPVSSTNETDSHDINYGWDNVG
jgi:hypothetical protein